MRLQEFILDIIGLSLIMLSNYDYFFRDGNFVQDSILGIAGLALLVMDGSQIKKYIKKVIDNKLK